MRVLIVAVCIICFASCSSQAPKENEVKELVKLWYMQQGMGDGAGRWEVDGVTVLSIRDDEEHKDIFHTTSLVTGTRYPAAIADPPPPEKFSDTLRMNLVWNGAKWITADE